MPRPRLHLPARAVLAAAAVAVVLLARGGDDPAARADPSGLLAQAFANASPVADGRLALTLEITSHPSGGGPLALRVEGPFAARRARGVPRFDLAVRVERRGGGLETSLVSTGEAGFVRVAGRPYRLDRTTWARLRDGLASGGEGTPGGALPRLGLEPGAWVRAPREVGRADDGGVEVVHLAAGARPEALAADLAGLLAAARALAGGGGPTAAGAGDGLGRALEEPRVDVWTGAGDGSLRRLAVTARLAPRRAGAAPGALRLDLRYADLNTGVAVPEPEGARPLAELGAALAEGAGPGDERTYARCIRRAGEDAAALERCARRLATPG
jgi:hypothetical protein